MPTSTHSALRALLVAVVLATGGCALGTASGTTSAGVGDVEALDPVVELPAASSASDVVLYDRFIQRLTTYDPTAGQVVETSNVPNLIQYAFTTPSDLFTSGSSVDNGFLVLRTDGAAIETVATMAEDEGVFPVATDGSTTFLLRTRYDADNTEFSRELVRLADDGTMVVWTGVTGLVDGGALLDGALHYTTFEPTTDDYTLHVVDAADPTAAPDVVTTGLASGRLYVHDGMLLTADDDEIIGASMRYPCIDICVFHDDLGILVRIHVDASNDLVLDVLDADDASVLATVPAPVDHAVEGDQLVVYTRNGVERVEVEA